MEAAIRIHQLVQSYAKQLELRPEQAVGSTRAFGEATRSNRARVTDSAKGFVQASKVRDGVAKVSSSLDRAREVLRKAQEPTVSPADKKKLQADFVGALADLDQGSKDQTAAVADTALANRTFDAKRVGVTAAADLGKGASIQIGSVAALKQVDLTTASSDQLAEAAKVLEAARGENDKRLATANAKAGAISGRLEVFEEVQHALVGTKAASADTKKRDIDSLLALIQRNQSLVPGSIFSSFG